MLRVGRRAFLKRAGMLCAAALAHDSLPPVEVPAGASAPFVRRPAGRPARTLGLFLPFHYLARAADIAGFQNIVLASGANTLVVDIKNPWGFVNVPFEHSLKASFPGYLEDPRPLETLLTWADRQGIFTIARQVVMMDGQLARFHPEYALKDAKGAIWLDLTGTPWANPYRPEVADYNATIAEAAVTRLGFRQVQFDLIRFPSSDSQIDQIWYDKHNTVENRLQAICRFLSVAQERVHRHQALLTADLFGYAAFEYQGDLGIGQDLERLGPYVDGVSPMAYPSLYRQGILLKECPGFCNPGIDHPYEVVAFTVQHMKQRLARANPAAFVEPWIQAYLPARAPQIELQRQAAFDSGAAGVLAWHTNYRYYQPTLFTGGRKATGR